MNWRNRIVGHGEESPESLLANPRNWRIHPQAQQDYLGGVLDEVGWIDEVLVNKQTGFVVDGHLRVAMAISKGEVTVPVKYIDVTEEEEELILVSLDPLAAMAATDAEKLEELMLEIETDNEAVEKMLADLARQEGIAWGEELPENPPPKIDRAAELREKWGTEWGQLWEIGSHRLAVGDCIDQVVADAVMMGLKADMIFMDPPYNVNYPGSNAWDSQTEIGAQGPVAGDDMGEGEYIKFVDTVTAQMYEILKPGGVYYICLGWAPWAVWYAQLNISGLKVHNQIVWNKINPKLYAHKPDFNPQHELLAYGWRNGAGHKFHYTPGTDQQWSTIWGIRRLQSGDMLHTMEKPVDLIRNAIELSSDVNELVADFFIGAGSTMVAAEQVRRRCYGIDIDPKYCAVTLERMADMGLEPKLTN